jgi:hypothetical protein
MPDYMISGLELLNLERLRQCSSLMLDYMTREVELQHAERLRQCSSLMPDNIRELELLYPEPLRQ